MPQAMEAGGQALFQLELERLLDQLAALLHPLVPAVVEPVLTLAIEIAGEGREGRKIGTIFMVGDSDHVLQHSRSLILDPLVGHSAAARRVTDPNLRGTIKELAQLDGAFVVSGSGVFLAACRYLDAQAADVALPFGLGARHMAAAAMSKVTSSVGVVVSETGNVRLFREGYLVAQISCAPKPRLQELPTAFIDAADR